MAYLLPRTVLVVVAWAMTCALIRRVSPEADLTIFGVAGLSWFLAAIGYFGYLSKLRRDIDTMARQRGLSRL
jgi:hypothetical protein